MNAHASAIERGWGRGILSSFHAAWSAGGLIGAAIGGLLISAGASPMLQLGIEGALCFQIAGIGSLRIGVGDRHAHGTTFALPHGRLITLAVEPVIAMGRQPHHPPLAERFARTPEAPVAPTPVEAMAHRLKTPEGHNLYALRKQTPEPVSSIIKSVLGFRQFSCAGWKMRAASGASSPWPGTSSECSSSTPPEADARSSTAPRHPDKTPACPRRRSAADQASLTIAEETPG